MLVEAGRVSVAPPVALVPSQPARVRLELPAGRRLTAEPAFEAFDAGTAAEVDILTTHARDALAWTVSGLPAGAFRLRVDAGPGFQPASAEVTTGEGGAAEAVVH